jgi:hypothetical protein
MALNEDDIIRLIKDYRNRLRGVELKPFTMVALTPTDTDARAHAAYLLDVIEAGARHSKLRRALRLLGFVQAVLWQAGLLTINEVKGQGLKDSWQESPEVPPAQVLVG